MYNVASTNRGYEWGCQWCESDGQEIEAPHQDPPYPEVVVLLLAPRLVTVGSKVASAPRRYPRHSYPQPPLLSLVPSSCRSLAALGNAWLSLWTDKTDRRIKQQIGLKAWRYHRPHGSCSLDEKCRVERWRDGKRAQLSWWPNIHCSVRQGVTSLTREFSWC